MKKGPYSTTVFAWTFQFALNEGLYERRETEWQPRQVPPVSWMEHVKEADETNLLWKYSSTVSSKVVYFGQNINNYKRFD